MKKSAIYLGAMMVMFFIASCSDDSTESRPIVEDAASAEVAADDDGTVASPEEVIDQAENKILSKESVEKLIADKNEEDPTRRTVNNTASIYKYVTTSPKHTVFATLIRASSLVKDLHHESYTIFAPLDSHWDQADKKRVLSWAKGGDTAEVDAYIKNHMMKVIVSASKLQRTESLNTAGTLVYEFDQENTTVNGIPFATNDYSVGNGNVIALEGNFPI